jgi:hypothetical protein
MPGRAGQVWVIQKSNPEDKELKSPRSHFGRENHYTVTTNETRDLRIENALAKVESTFAQVMSRLKRQQRLRPKDRVYLSFFTAAMFARVEPFTNTVIKALRTVKAQAERLAHKDCTSNGLSQEVGTALNNVVGDTVSVGVIENQKMLERMSLTILTVDDDAGFITSDAPGCLCIPGTALHPFLGHYDVEAMLPLSPRHLAIYTWTAKQVRYKLGIRWLVDEANSRIMSRTVKEFVSWKGIVRAEWFIKGL